MKTTPILLPIEVHSRPPGDRTQNLRISGRLRIELSLPRLTIFFTVSCIGSFTFATSTASPISPNIPVRMIGFMMLLVMLFAQQFTLGEFFFYFGPSVVPTTS